MYRRAGLDGISLRATVGSSTSLSTLASDDSQASVPDAPGRYLATKLSKKSAGEILNRTLSIGSVVVMWSSFAWLSNQVATRHDFRYMTSIGEGLRGAVFETVVERLALKKEHPGRSTLRTCLKREYEIHTAVMAALERYESLVHSDVLVPHLIGYFSSASDLCDLSMFPGQFGDQTAVMLMERILPLPRVTREALADYFYPFQEGFTTRLGKIQDIVEATANKHCLVRVYLGKSGVTFNAEKFSLRNFPLCLEPMERLALDTHCFAASMGKACAMMHWGAGVDGNGVEFVLGTSLAPPQGGDRDWTPEPGFSPSKSPREMGHYKSIISANHQYRVVGLYLLDFGECELVDLSQPAIVVYQVFKGAMLLGDNKLFIPNCKHSPELFASFKKAYMEAGDAIVKDKKLHQKFSMSDFMAQYEEYAGLFL